MIDQRDSLAREVDEELRREQLLKLWEKYGTYVVAARPKFELLAHNVFADDSSRTNGSVAVSNGQLLLRTDQYLYCIGKQ